jgi:signal peptide peptidase SppA
MRLVDILTSPWAILPEKLLEIQAIYQTHLRGEKIDLSIIEARLGRPLANEPKPYEVVKGVAVIEMEGIVAKRMSMFSKISGGVSTYHVQEQFDAAMNDPKVKAVLLAIDSPGGSVDGTAELAGMIHAARGEKPVVAFTDGLMCSAAYWIGSAADAIYISGDTPQVGSIGVVASHMDISKAEEMMGVKTTEIAAGKYKRIASRHMPLSKEGRQNIQEMVDYVYSAFVADVAKHRGVSEEQALEQMADGRIFYGRQAVNAGLVDGVSTMEELIEKMASGEMPMKEMPKKKMPMEDDEEHKKKKMNKSAAAGGPEATVHEEVSMFKLIAGGKTIEIEGESLTLDVKYVSENAPDIADALRLEGMVAERMRIQGIEENALPGYEAIVAEAKKDGKSTGADVAQRIVKAENEKREKKLGDIRAGAPPALPQPPVDGVLPGKGEEAVDTTLPVEERAKKEWDTKVDIRKEFSSFESFLAFKRNEEAGRIRVLSRK